MSEYYNDFQSLIPAGESTSGATPLWWEPQTIHPNIVTELRRRSNKINIGMYNTNDICLNFTPENYWKYRGPMTPWVRCFSNGTGERNNKSIPVSKYLGGKSYNGFLLQGGEGFYRGYGVSYENNSLDKTDQIIGYQADGTPHYIKSEVKNNFYNIAGDKFTPSMLPPPGIVSADIRCIKDNFLSYVTINWKCFGLAQLEYMIPFFLTPGINIFFEMGWNLFNYKSLIDYNDVRYDEKNPENSSDTVKLVTTPQFITEKFYESMGNYGCFSGIIWKYDINQKDGIEFDCRTEIVSRQNFYAGYIINKNDKNNNSISTWITQNLKNIKSVLNLHKRKPVKIYGSTVVYDNNSFEGSMLGGFNGPMLPTNIADPIPVKSTQEILNELKNISDDIKNKNNIIKENEDIINELKSNNITIESLTEKYNKEFDQEQKIQSEQLRSSGKEDTTVLGKIEKLAPKNVSSENRKKWIIAHYSIPQKRYTDDKLKNDINYNIINEANIKINNAKKELEKNNSEFEKKSKLLENSLSNFIQYFNVIKNGDLSEVSFYNGKDEDRVFISPGFGFDDDNSKYKSNSIINGIYLSNVENTFKVSDNEFGWVQLDFIFELINYLSKLNDDKSLNINIRDTIINAHPNLISCDPDVIIPNAIAPKLNVPTPLLVNNNTGDVLDDFGNKLTITKEKYKEEIRPIEGINGLDRYLNIGGPTNAKLNVNSYLTYQDTKIIDNYIKQEATSIIETEDNPDLFINRSLLKCKTKFLIKDENMRDNIDMIVNRYYHINHPDEDTSIPALKDIEIHDKNRTSKRVYRKYNYGYLRYVYISVRRLISIYDSLSSNARLKDFAIGILNVVNESVCNYWNLDIVSDGNGSLMVIDKGLGADPQIPVYTFEIGTTNSPVKKFNFNINLSNEQTTQVLYSSGANTNSINGEKVDTKVATCSEVKEKDLPAFSYKDRINNLIYNIENQEKSNVSLAKYNDDIQLLQTSYNIPYTNIVRVEVGKDSNKHSYVCLNMPPVLKPYIKDILYTPLVIEGENEEEIKEKVQKADEDNGYTGPADNFTVTLTFDGIMGFRMLEYFAIENLPKPYNKENVMFVISEVRHQISKNGWETVVTAMLKTSKNQNFKYIII